MMWMELQLQLKTIPKWRLNCFRSDLFFISSTHFSFLFLCPLHLSSISPNAISFARCDASKNRTQNTNPSSAFFRTIEHYWRAEDFPYCFFFLSLSLPDETINSENLNGHATSNVTSEEVKVHIESPEPLLEEQATGPVKTEDKTGNFWL